VYTKPDVGTKVSGGQIGAKIPQHIIHLLLFRLCKDKKKKPEEKVFGLKPLEHY
jgi:hypothetical protein